MTELTPPPTIIPDARRRANSDGQSPELWVWIRCRDEAEQLELAEEFQRKGRFVQLIATPKT
jgi:hypothetical protein